MLNAKMLMLDVELLMLNAIFTPTDIECGILLEPITTKINSDFPRKNMQNYKFGCQNKPRTQAMKHLHKITQTQKISRIKSRCLEHSKS